MTKEQMERYFREYRSPAYRIAFAQLKNHADAEDVVQELFVRLLRSETEYRSREHEKAWVIRTTINLCRDLQKSRWKKSRVDVEHVSEQEEYRKLFCLVEDDTLRLVLLLPEALRNCLYLFYYEDYSIREIAAMLDMPENTVKTNLRRGRERVKKLLEVEDDSK